MDFPLPSYILHPTPYSQSQRTPDLHLLIPISGLGADSQNGFCEDRSADRDVDHRRSAGVFGGSAGAGGGGQLFGCVPVS